MVAINQILNDKSRNIKVENTFDYIELSRKGLSVKQLHDILKFTNISTHTLLEITSFSSQQINKQNENEILPTELSVQLIQIVELYTKGYELFEDKQKFRQWMDTNIPGLGNSQPKSLLDTTFGIQLIINELGRLEHGIIS